MYGIRLNDRLTIALKEELTSVVEDLRELLADYPDNYFITERLKGDNHDEVVVQLCHDEEGNVVPDVELELYFQDDMLTNISILGSQIYSKFFIISAELTAKEAVEKYKDNYKRQIYCEGLNKIVDRDATTDVCSWSKKHECSEHCPEGTNQKDYLSFSDDNVFISIFEQEGYDESDPTEYKFSVMYLDYGD